MSKLRAWLKQCRQAFVIKHRPPRASVQLEPLEKRLVPSFSPSGTAFLALAGQSFSGVIGSFTPEAGTSPSDYQAIVIWGVPLPEIFAYMAA